MREVDLSRPLNQLPFWVVPLSILMLILPLVPFMVLHGLHFTLSNLWSWWIVPGLLLGILLHEGVHALAWKYSSGLAWSQFTFGIKWEALAPYCHAKAPMSRNAYRIGALAPLIVTGILPLIVSYFNATAPLAFFSALMISAAIGDVFVLWMIRHVPPQAQLIDHPENAGCIMLLPEATVGDLPR